MSTPTSPTHPFPSTYPVWSGSRDVTLWDEVRKCYKIVFWALRVKRTSRIYSLFKLSP